MKIETINQLNFEDYFKPDVPLADNIYMPGMDGWEDALTDFSNSKLFGCDIETFGSGWWQGLSARHGYIRLISVALPNEKALIVDLGGWKDSDVEKADKLNKAQDFLAILKTKLFDKSVLVTGANFKFDANYLLARFGFKTRSVFDVLLMSQVYWAGVGVTKGAKGDERSIVPHNLKAVAERLGFYDVSKEEQQSAWGWDLSNRQLNYGAQDSLIVLKIFYKLKELLKEEDLLYTAKAESMALPVFSEMETFGFPIDLEHAKRLLDNYKWLYEKVAKPFNDAFPGVSIHEQKTLLAIFQEKWPDWNLESVGSGDLNEYRYLPEIDSLLEARSLDISITYIQKIIELAYDSPSGFKSVQTNFRQIGPAGTGRSTSSEWVKKQGTKKAVTGLQLQNPPNTPEKFEILYSWYRSQEKLHHDLSLKTYEKEVYYNDEFEKEKLLPLRSCFIAPPGYKLLVVDLSSAHQRIATQLSKDPVLIDVYNNDRDPHLLMANRIANQDGYKWSEEDMIKFKSDSSSPYHGKVKWYRKIGKIGNYSQLNLGGVVRVLAELKKLGIEADEDFAKMIQRVYRKELYTVLVDNIFKAVDWANHPDQEQVFKVKERTGKLHDYLKYGTVRGLTNRRAFFAKKPSKFKQGVLEVALTDATAFRWLSAEADMIKMMMGLALLHFDQHSEWGAYFCNFAHDEMNIIVKEEYAQECAKYVLDLMIKVMSRFIKVIPVIDPKTPMDGSGFICNNWSEK